MARQLDITLNITIKVPLLDLKQFLTTESPLKVDKKAFYFMLKSAFRSWDIQIFVSTFWLVEKRLDKKVKVNSQISDVTDWTANNYNTYIV